VLQSVLNGRLTTPRCDAPPYGRQRPHFQALTQVVGTYVAQESRGVSHEEGHRWPQLELVELWDLDDAQWRKVIERLPRMRPPLGA
jgi:hypothetical protein